MFVLVGLVRQLGYCLDVECLSRDKVVEVCRGSTVRVLLDKKGDIRTIGGADGCVWAECWEPSASCCMASEEGCYAMSVSKPQVTSDPQSGDHSHTGVNPLVASSPGNLNFSSFVSWLTIRASSRVKLTKPIAGNTGFCPRLFCGCAGPEDDFDMLNATRPAPAAAASPRVAGETEARSLRGVAIVYRNKYGLDDRVTVNR